MVFRQEDFTEQAQLAIAASYEIVHRFKHQEWDMEHLMLALLENSEGVPVQMLNYLQVNIRELEEEIVSLLNETPALAKEASQIYPTPRVKSLLDNQNTLLIISFLLLKKFEKLWPNLVLARWTI